MNSDMMRNMLRGGNWSEGFRISDFSCFLNASLFSYSIIQLILEVHEIITIKLCLEVLYFKIYS